MSELPSPPASGHCHLCGKFYPYHDPMVLNDSNEWVCPGACLVAITDHAPEYALLKKIFPQLGLIVFTSGSGVRYELHMKQDGSFWVWTDNVEGHEQSHDISDYEALAIVERVLRLRLEERWSDVYLGKRQGIYTVRCFNWAKQNGIGYANEHTNHTASTLPEALFLAWKAMQ